MISPAVRMGDDRVRQYDQFEPWCLSSKIPNMAMFLTFQVETDARLAKAEYIFEFQERVFRLVRGTDTELDKLCTITDGSAQENAQAYETAMRLFDYLSWQWQTGIRCMDGGGPGFQSDEPILKILASRPIQMFHARMLRSMIVEPLFLPDVRNDVLQVALGLLNEALQATSPFFRFINFWKILGLPHSGDRRGNADKRAIARVDRAASERVPEIGDLRNRLKQRGIHATLGNYLYEECRNAIAHITRPPALSPSKLLHRDRILEAERVAEHLARFYIRTELGLGRYAVPMKILKSKKRSSAFKLLRRCRQPR